MKFSKSALIFLVSGIFVIIVAVLGMIYLNQTSQHERLKEELALAQMRIKNYPAKQAELLSQREELKSRLAEAESQLAVAKDSLNRPVESIEASNALFQIATIAEACYVNVTDITSPGLEVQTLEGVNLSCLPISVTIEGDLSDINEFIYKWTKEYPTGVVKSVAITVPEPPVDEEIAEGDQEQEEAEEERKPSATITLFIYSYEGD